MPQIEGFHVRNYRSLRDVTIGRLHGDQKTLELTKLIAVIGKNGSGKSTLLDAFGFISECLAIGVEAACGQPQRGGFERLRSRGAEGPIRFEIYYREGPGQRPITYELAIDVDHSGRPFVRSEILSQRLRNQRHVRPKPFLYLDNGEGLVWADDDAPDVPKAASSKGRLVQLTDTGQLGVATLGALGDHPRIAKFRDFLKGWYLSYFHPDAARGLPGAGPQRHLNIHGDNLGNVVQFMEREHTDRFQSILQRIAQRIPGVTKIDTLVTEDRRVLLRFNDGSFKDPFYAQQMSDGTLKVFAYLLLLEDPDPPPFIGIEEPENGLYHKLLEVLATEFRDHASAKGHSTQIFVTTHQPYFLDALRPEEVWILEKDADGFSVARHVSDLPIVQNLVAEGLPLGGLWYSDYLDQR